jgi:hypothetical protein
VRVFRAKLSQYKILLTFIGFTINIYRGSNLKNDPGVSRAQGTKEKFPREQTLSPPPTHYITLHTLLFSSLPIGAFQ